ncbi:hypothetical protein MMC2321_01073 [Chitinophaga sp. MM2321]
MITAKDQANAKILKKLVAFLIIFSEQRRKCKDNRNL